VLKGDQAVRLPAALGFEPTHHGKGGALRIEQGHLMDGQAHDQLGSAVQDGGKLSASARAAISDHQIAGLPTGQSPEARASRRQCHRAL
jgi:hypothetical protein